VNFAGVKSITIPEGDVKSIAIGGVTVWQKPNPLPYDAEVEYVEANGAQYVDTGRVFAETDYLAVDTLLAENSPSAYYLHGANGTGNVRFTLGKGAAAWNDWYFGLGDKNLRTGVAIDSARHLLALDGLADTAYVDGVAYAIGHAAWSGTAGAVATATLCARTNVSTGGRNGYWIGRVYAAQIRTGGASGALVRDFIPVRVGTAGYLYDRANPTGGPSGNGLYGSATSTPLVAGPDKNGA
jgi:hypothetical protein